MSNNTTRRACNNSWYHIFDIVLLFRVSLIWNLNEVPGTLCWPDNTYHSYFRISLWVKKFAASKIADCGCTPLTTLTLGWYIWCSLSERRISVIFVFENWPQLSGSYRQQTVNRMVLLLKIVSLGSLKLWIYQNVAEDTQMEGRTGWRDRKMDKQWSNTSLHHYDVRWMV